MSETCRIDLALMAHLAPPGTRLQRGSLRASTTRLSDPCAVLDAMRAFGGQGWVEWTDRVTSHVEALPPQELGHVLHAQWACGARSLHVRAVDGQWWLTTWTESPDGEDWLVGRSCLASDPALGRLNYREVWQRGTDGSLVVGGARFAGYGVTQEDPA